MSNAQTILVVDDTDIVREPLVSLLAAKGYRSIGASNGREAWESIALERPALVLLDILMPEMNGLEFLSLLRSDEDLADLPVVVLTAVSDDAWEKDIRALGVQGFMRKAGFSPDELLQVIQPYVGERRGESGAPT